MSPLLHSFGYCLQGISLFDYFALSLKLKRVLLFLSSVFLCDYFYSEMLSFLSLYLFIFFFVSAKGFSLLLLWDLHKRSCSYNSLFYADYNELWSQRKPLQFYFLPRHTLCYWCHCLWLWFCVSINNLL